MAAKHILSLAFALALLSGSAFAVDQKESALSTVPPSDASTVTGLQTGANVNFSFSGIAAYITAKNLTWTGTNTFNNTVSGTGITGLFASPPAIGGTAPSTGAFTNLSASGTVSGTGFSNYLASPPAIGGGTPAAITGTAITGTTGTFSGAILLSGLSAGTQVSCLGLDSGNHVVTNAAACGSGSGGSWTLTDGTHSVSGVTQVTVTGGTVGGTTPNATLAVTASAGGTANQIQYNNASALGGFTLGGDCTLVVGTGVITCTKTGGSAFATVATSGSASDLSTGTLPAARLPNPSASTLGGVESKAAVTSNWINAISTSGVPSATQPAFTDISGTATLAQLPTLPTNQILGNSSGSTGAMSGQAIGAGLVMNSNGLQTTVPDRTAANGTTIGTADMGGFATLTGTGNLVVPAPSSTLFATGMSFSYQNTGTGIITATGTALNGLPHTAQPPGAFGTIVSRDGSTLDWTGLTTPTATQIGGIMSKDCTSGGQFVQIIGTDGTITCNTPAGGGDLSHSGTMTTHGVAVVAGSTLIGSTATGASGIALIGAGASADPVFGTVIVAGGGTGARTFTAHSLIAGEGTGAMAALGAATNGQLPIGSTGADPVLAALTPTSPIGVTNGAGSITIACATCVVASSPGAGIAHFAGSTQTVTSSAIVAADITNGTITGTQIASSIALAGSPTTTTQSALDNSTKVATTAYVDTNFTGAIHAWGAAQRGTPSTITVSTLTFTPNFDAANNFALTLVHSTSNVLANPSTTPVAGQSGMFAITQSSTGGDTLGGGIGTDYFYAGGTSAITLSTGANVTDYLPYYVFDATHIILGGIIKGPTH